MCVPYLPLFLSPIQNKFCESTFKCYQIERPAGIYVYVLSCLFRMIWSYSGEIHWAETDLHVNNLALQPPNKNIISTRYCLLLKSKFSQLDAAETILLYLLSGKCKRRERRKIIVIGIFHPMQSTSKVKSRITPV